MKPMKLLILLSVVAAMLSGCSALTGDKPWQPSPYRHNPEFDVYVRGEYVGSDPDPRIRWSLKKEWKSGMGMGLR